MIRRFQAGRARTYVGSLQETQPGQILPIRWRCHRCCHQPGHSGGPQTEVFSVCQPWVSPQVLAARLIASGDVEQNPGPPKSNKNQKTAPKTRTINPNLYSSVPYAKPKSTKNNTRSYAITQQHIGYTKYAHKHM